MKKKRKAVLGLLLAGVTAFSVLLAAPVPAAAATVEDLYKSDIYRGGPPVVRPELNPYIEILLDGWRENYPDGTEIRVTEDRRRFMSIKDSAREAWGIGPNDTMYKDIMISRIADDNTGNIPETPEPIAPPEAAEISYGDLNGDGNISLKDAQLALRAALNIVDSAPYKTLMDVNADGRLDLSDCTLILKRSLNLINRFPAENTASGVPSETPIPPAPTQEPETSEEPEDTFPTAPPKASEATETSQMPAPPAPTQTGDWYVTFPEYVEIHHPDGTYEIRYYDNRCVHNWEQTESEKIIKEGWSEQTIEYEVIEQKEYQEVIFAAKSDDRGFPINLTELYYKYLVSGDWRTQSIENSCKKDIIGDNEEALAEVPETDSYKWFVEYLSNDMQEKYLIRAFWTDTWESLFKDARTEYMEYMTVISRDIEIWHPAETEGRNLWKCKKCGKEVTNAGDKVFAG